MTYRAPTTTIGYFGGVEPTKTRSFHLPHEANWFQLFSHSSAVSCAVFDASNNHYVFRGQIERGIGIEISYPKWVRQSSELYLEVFTEEPWELLVRVPSSAISEEIPWTTLADGRGEEWANPREFVTYANHLQGAGPGVTAPLPIREWPDEQELYFHSEFDDQEGASIFLQASKGRTDLNAVDGVGTWKVGQLRNLCSEVPRIAVQARSRWDLWIFAPLPNSEALHLQWENGQNCLSIQNRRPELESSEIAVRMPCDAYDFEVVCQEWASEAGYDVDVTSPGPDRGLDLVGPDFAGQSKFHPSQKISAPLIREFFGAATQAGKSVKMFFHYGPGFTAEALLAAQELGVHLWKLNVSTGKFVQAGYESDGRRCDQGASI